MMTAARRSPRKSRSGAAGEERERLLVGEPGDSWAAPVNEADSTGGQRQASRACRVRATVVRSFTPSDAVEPHGPRDRVVKWSIRRDGYQELPT